VSFAKEVSKKDAADIRSYVIFRANQSRNEGKGDASPGGANGKP